MSSTAPAPSQQERVPVIFGALILVFLLASLDQTIVSVLDRLARSLASEMPTPS